jgi:hypothetical protein
MKAAKIIRLLSHVVEHHGDIDIQITGSGHLSQSAIQLSHIEVGKRGEDSEIEPNQSVGYLVKGMMAAGNTNILYNSQGEREVDTICYS